jgi:hypothetical protein
MKTMLLMKKRKEAMNSNMDKQENRGCKRKPRAVEGRGDDTYNARLRKDEPLLIKLR